MPIAHANMMEISGSRVSLHIGRGKLNDLGELARMPQARDGESGPEGFHALLVTDPGIISAGHAARALSSLHRAAIRATLFSGVQDNPTTYHVQAGVNLAKRHRINLIVGLGGGSAMDCAKGINFLYTNGGAMQDYRGINKATRPMLPLIAIPTTAGTGSEAQSFALITDPDTHEKMACGDDKALPRVAILDPDLLETCPLKVVAATGIDAVSHAVETAGCNKRTEISRRLSKQAWSLLSESLPAMLVSGAENEARGLKLQDMLLGAHVAGAAIQNSMLGAAHACANPLTARFDIVHGVAVGLMLPHVIRFNAQFENPYSDLDADPARLLRRVQELLALAGIPRNLRHFEIPEEALPSLAAAASLQWTAAFNPRPVTTAILLEIYRQAWSSN